jgi:ribonuclease HII
MANESIAQIKIALAGEPSAEQLTVWETDTRKGVQAALLSFRRRQAKAVADRSAFEDRLAFERNACEKGLVVAGVDEVGRGPLAGPVVAAAVVIDQSFDLLAVHDSKQLTQKKRLALDEQIKAQAVDYAFGIVDASQIDEVNIYEASRIAMKQAVEKLTISVDALLIDAMTVDLNLPQEKLIKGDDRSISIGAASILAKNFRDQLMADYAELYPGYGFERNAGYGTAEHLAALKKLGPTDIHRKTFAPVKDFV